ncbi:serine/threonine protein kinase [Minicystis rosea]|nr:serine/threonine protein kinase [Minicystis rosea]
MPPSDVFGIVGTTQAGNFHVERVVAEGGFGVVYRAQHGAFRAPVALKCLKIPEEMTKPQRAVFLEQFREEAELMFRLSAAISEIVRPLHVDALNVADGRFVPFLALEWLDGESLDGIITRRREQKQAPLGIHKVVKMLRPVAGALSRAHRFPGPQGAIAIIHRDLKPENIFVANIGGTESMKILDFGIAKAKRAASQAVGRATGRSIADDVAASFTPAYGAPEQWTPKTFGETGPWTDVWGLALTLTEALCGSPPIDGDTYVMRRICLDEKRRPTPRTLGADVPMDVERVFERALALDPRRRFKDIETFWSELEIAIGIEPSLRSRDARREPSEPHGHEAEKAPAARLGRIDLVKMPAAVVTSAAEPAPPLSAKPPSSGKVRPPEGVVRSDPRSVDRAPPSAAQPRAQSVGMELPLPTHASSGSLEAVLPMQADGPPVPASAQPSMDLEMALPIHDDGAPDPPKRGPVSAQRAPASGASAQASSMDLEMALPIRDAAPEQTSAPDGGGPPRKPSGELELDLASAPEPSIAAGATDFELSVSTSPAKAPSSVEVATTGPRSGVDRGAGRSAVPEYEAPAHAAMTLGERLQMPLAILLLGLAVGLCDFFFQKSAGNPFMLGPVRLSWVAALLALVGVGFLLWRLIGVNDDE